MDTDITIVGAGVVGLAIAAEISRTNKDVFLMEKHLKFGQETSSRNSEVIHSGIYYPHGSLKGSLCVSGRQMLYDYCQKNDILHRMCGKLVVATDDFEMKQLPKIFDHARKNGVTDAELIEQDDIRNLEPNIFALQAIRFPSTGIIDTHGLMKQLETEACINGTQIVYGSEVKAIRKLKKGYEITISDADESEYNFTSGKIINSAGLYSDKIAEMIGINKPEYCLHFWKGEYFSVGNGKHKLINGLVYPVPESNTVSLGIHATIDFTGRMKLGPSAAYMKENIIDYTVDTKNKELFLKSAGRFLPFLEIEDLQPDQAGIRPKLQKPGDATRDFIIKEESDNGFPGFVNLIGIESPGLTSCLAIAKYINSLI
ncbi:MAG: NAD(P)/FAD-dependent oxidoreductase [Bacteroidota bacterium]